MQKWQLRTAGSPVRGVLLEILHHPHVGASLPVTDRQTPVREGNQVAINQLRLIGIQRWEIQVDLSALGRVEQLRLSPLNRSCRRNPWR